MNQPPTSNGIPEVDPNLMYSDPTSYHRQMEARNQALIQQAIAAATPSVVTPLASMAREHAKTYRPEIWSRYGPEIESTMAQLGPQAQADVASWKRVVNYVAGEHTDEIVASAVAAARGTDTGMLTSDGAPPVPTSTSSPLRKFFADHPEIEEEYKRDGLKVADVLSFYAGMGYTDETKIVEKLSRKFRLTGVA